MPKKAFGKRGLDWGEKIATLEIFYGSQKKIADRFGVSTRTIRRWKVRGDVPRSSKADTEKVNDSLRWFTKRKPLRDTPGREDLSELEGQKSVVLNDIVPTTDLSILASRMDTLQSDVVAFLVDEKPDVTLRVQKSDFGAGPVITVPRTGDEVPPEDGGGELAEYRIPGRFIRDWPALRGWFWKIFQESYPG